MMASMASRVTAGRPTCMAGATHAVRLMRCGRSVTSAMSASERSFEDTPMVDGIPGDFLGSATFAEDVEPVAVLQFFQLCRVPNEGPALHGFGTDQLVDLLFGADVDATHGIVEEDDARIGGKR